MKTFKELGLSQNLLKILEELNFTEPSEIQEKVIPLALANRDVIGESATGSGKTLAFGAPIIEKIKAGKGLQVLVLTPTRELAEQVSRALLVFSKYTPLKIIAVYGGVSIEPQIESLKRADIVVGTPGRMLDHIKRRTIDLSKVKFLVLDEADRMLDMGFIYDVTEIVDYCPKERQSFLFSATISEDITRIAKEYMNNPITVSAESYVDPSKLEQVFYDVPSNEKFSLLMHLLKQESSKLVMVFCNTKRNADVLGESLRRYGFDALTLHGDLSQNRRSYILEKFHKSEKFILVCTDVAARGLDIKNVSHIYNYDSPKTSIEYIHRIGRTARAGKEGKAVTIVSERDYENFRRVSSDPELNIVKTTLPEFEKIFVNLSGKRPGEQRDKSYRRERFRNDRRSFGSERRRFGDTGRSFDGRNERRSFGGRNEKRIHRNSQYKNPRSLGRRKDSRSFSRRSRH